MSLNTSKDPTGISRLSSFIFMKISFELYHEIMIIK